MFTLTLRSAGRCLAAIGARYYCLGLDRNADCCGKRAGLKIKSFQSWNDDSEPRWLRPLWRASVITLLQKYRFPLSPSNTPQDEHTLCTHPRPSRPAPRADSTLHKHTLCSTHSSVCPSPPSKRSRSRTTSSFSSSSPPPPRCRWEHPGVGVWPPDCLIQDSEGRLICIADSCATIGYILPHPEPENQENQERNNLKPKERREHQTSSLR